MELKEINKKIDDICDVILGSITKLGNKFPEYLEKNMGKIYFLFFLLTLVAIKEAYYQRGYFAIGGEAFIMIFPVMLDCWLKMRD